MLNATIKNNSKLLYGGSAPAPPSRTPRCQAQAGFTLIEIIITLVLIAITGTALFQFMNTTIPFSSSPANWVRQEAMMGSMLEEMTADFIHEVTDNTLTTDFNAFVNDFVASASARSNTDITVDAAKVCFNANGDMVSACASNAVPLARIIVEDDNGRQYAVLFAQTRMPSDPEDAR